MTRLASNVADYLFEAGPVAPPEAMVVRFRGREAISELYRFVVDLVSEDYDLAMEDVVGQAAVLTVMGSTDVRYVHGLVSRFEMIGQGKDYAEYRAEIVPRFWLATQKKRSRIFQDKTVPQILEEVFKGYQLKKEEDYSLPKLTDQRVYCVQYNESDFDFVSRILEEEGAFYYFEHSGEREKMIISDQASVHQPIVGDPVLEFRDVYGGSTHEEFVYRLAMSREIRPGKVTLRDYDFEKPSVKVEQEKAGEADAALEVYTYPGEFVQSAVGKRYAEVRLQEYNAPRVRIRGRSSCRRFLPGSTADVSKHPRADINTSYLLVAVEHEGNQKEGLPGTGGVSGGEEEPSYENYFVAQPASIIFRPPRITPRPRILGAQTAVVTGPGNEEVHTDKHGRIKIKFHWDREGPVDDASSCWVRVSQLWSGLGWGGMFLPRVGQEVVVEHEEGDPDRPLVVGRVYNGEQVPPYPLPGEKTKSTIKSQTSPGGGGFNEIRLEDASGSEEIYVHAQKDMNTVVENNQTHSVGADRTRTVTGNEKVTVKKEQELTVDKKRTKTVNDEEHITVVKKRDTTLKDDEIVKITGKEDKTVKKTLKYTVTESITFECGASKVVLKKDGSIEVNGVAIAIKGTQQVGISGGQVTSEATMGPNHTKGQLVMSEATATNTIKGAMVMLNP